MMTLMIMISSLFLVFRTNSLEDDDDNDDIDDNDFISVFGVQDK